MERDPHNWDWPGLWSQQGDEPAGLTAAADELLRLARAGTWAPSEADRSAWRQLHRVLTWSPRHPTGPTVGEVHQVFYEVLALDLSAPMDRVLRAAARWEPKVPRPGTWSETVHAVLVGDLEH